MSELSVKLLAQGGANDDNDAGFSLMRMTLPSAEMKEERKRERGREHRQ